MKNECSFDLRLPERNFEPNVMLSKHSLPTKNKILCYGLESFFSFKSSFGIKDAENVKPKERDIFSVCFS